MNEDKLLERITYNPDIFGGKPVIRGRRLAVEHILGMLSAGDGVDTILEGYPWLEREDILACLARETEDVKSALEWLWSDPAYIPRLLLAGQ